MHTEYVSVREGILSLLAEGPSYGFALKTHFETATGGTWPLNVGQVYTTLDRLERDGLVVMEETDDQKLYRLTDAGHDELEDWWEAVPNDGPPPRDELLIKLLLALPHGKEHALAVLSRQRSALAQILHARRQAAITTGANHSGELGQSPATFAAALLDDAVLMRTEADLRWLDRCEARIAADLNDLTTTGGPEGGADPGHRADTNPPRPNRLGLMRRNRR